jgi:succinate dehydrogenase hydrophobic anchor subunit
MKERDLMLLHYITGIGILVFGSIHIATVFFTYPLQDTIWETTLRFDSIPYAVLPVYRNALLAASLFGLLLCTTVHAMNGLRTIIAELIGARKRWVEALLVAVGVFLMVYGTRTILIAHALV